MYILFLLRLGLVINHWTMWMSQHIFFLSVFLDPLLWNLSFIVLHKYLCHLHSCCCARHMHLFLLSQRTQRLSVDLFSRMWLFSVFTFYPPGSEEKSLVWSWSSSLEFLWPVSITLRCCLCVFPQLYLHTHILSLFSLSLSNACLSFFHHKPWFYLTLLIHLLSVPFLMKSYCWPQACYSPDFLIAHLFFFILLYCISSTVCS